MKTKKHYLDDGISVEFGYDDNDGAGFWVSADGTALSCQIFLTEEAVAELNSFVKSINENLAEQADQHAQADGPRAGEGPR